MLSTLLRRAMQISRRLYVRVLLIACLNLVVLVLAKVLDPLIPAGASEAIGAKAVDPILQTLASSMLAVTIFSLTIMTGAFRTASSQWSPRTHVILKDDTTTHSVLSTFVGAYLFALLAIVLRASHFFGEKEIVVLFAFTICVIALIVISLVRWIAHLEELGSLDKTADQVQARAAQAMRAVGQQPCLGAQMLSDPEAVARAGFTPVHARKAGYVQQVFVARLQTCAEAEEVRIYVTAAIGGYVQAGDVLGYCDGIGEVSQAARVLRESILIDSVRSFQQDPGFGLLVLGEIASRALSPGINDPETAVAMAHRLATVLLLAAPSGGEGDPEPELDRVWLRPPDLDGFCRDSFDRIARDAGDKVEVHLAIAQALHGVTEAEAPALAEAARACAGRCAERARKALADDPDLDRYQSAIGAR